MPENTWRAYGLAIVSETPLIELPVDLLSARSEDPHNTNYVRVDLVPGGSTASPAQVMWLHHSYLPSGAPWRSCGKGADGYLVRFHKLADFEISTDGDRITCFPDAETPSETIRHLLLDQVLPLCLNVRGGEALHASSVMTPAGACGFLGETGTGKSTLAASLAATGWTMLGDDCLPLAEQDGHIVAIPSYPGVRLWPRSVAGLNMNQIESPRVSHYNEKKRVAVGEESSTESQPLCGLFVLAKPESARDDSIQIRQVSAVDALRELLEHAFRLDITDQKMLAREFRFFGHLVAQVPIYRLSYPRDFSSLGEVRRVIFETLTAQATFT